MDNDSQIHPHEPRSSNELHAEKSEPAVADFGPAPDGGTTAWLAAAGGFMVFFCCLGMANAFGSFEQYYLTHQLSDRSPSDIAWIGSICTFIQFAVGMVTGPMFDRLGAKMIRPAALAYVVALMILSICKTYWQFMLVQGVLMGVIMGTLQIPVFASVLHWFDKKRAAAFGLVVAGSSIGGVIIPIAISKMLNGTSLGYGWTVRIIGFITIPLLSFSCVTIKSRLPPRTTRFWIPEVFRNTRYLILATAMFFSFIGMFTPLFYLPTYATSRGVQATLAGYMLAILNASSTFGRIIPGILADKVGRINAFAFGAIITGIIVFCFEEPETTAALIVYAIFIGFCSGSIVSGASVALTVCVKDAREVGTYLGMGLFFAGFGSLIGPPINGALVARYGGFFEAAMFSGAVTVLGGFVALSAKTLTPQGLLGKI